MKSLHKEQHVDLQKTSTRLHLTYLDGLRGIAALYIVLFHALMEVNHCFQNHDLSPSVQRLSRLIWYGHSAVAVFIVLSGFCLMLPIMTSGGMKTLDSIGHYFVRRARRILPAYYAALFLSLMLVALMQPWLAVTDTYWDFAQPAFSPGSIVSHLLLIHNVQSHWMYTINPPMWSVALEWQIYFLFPLILLPVFRRFGILAAVVCAFTIALGTHFVLPAQVNVDWIANIYFALFSLGMLAATLVLPREAQPITVYSERYWLCGTAIFAAAFLLPDMLHINPLQKITWLPDALIGMMTACLIIYCAKSKNNLGQNSPSILLRVLEARWAVKIGTFSYSLYLLHNPLQALMHLPMQAAGLSAIVRLVVLLTIGNIVCIFAAYGFYLIFERPFISKGSNTVGVGRVKNRV